MSGVNSGKVIGLDLGTKTGWAWTTNGEAVGNFSGVESFQPGRYEGGGMRYLRFRGFLDSLAAQGTPQAIFFEEVRSHKGAAASHVYGGFLATLTAWCEERGIPYQGIPVGTIKRHATGKGNANKAAMIEAAQKRWPLCGIEDDNQADALWVLDCGLAQLGGVQPEEKPC